MRVHRISPSKIIISFFFLLGSDSYACSTSQYFDIQLIRKLHVGRKKRFFSLNPMIQRFNLFLYPTFISKIIFNIRLIWNVFIHHNQTTEKTRDWLSFHRGVVFSICESNPYDSSLKINMLYVAIFMDKLILLGLLYSIC